MADFLLTCILNPIPVPQEEFCCVNHMKCKVPKKASCDEQFKILCIDLYRETYRPPHTFEDDDMYSEKT